MAAIILGAFKDNPSTDIMPSTTMVPVTTGTRASAANLKSFSNRHVIAGINSAAMPDKKTISEETDCESARESVFRDTKNVPGYWLLTAVKAVTHWSSSGKNDNTW